MGFLYDDASLFSYGKITNSDKYRAKLKCNQMQTRNVGTTSRLFCGFTTFVGYQILWGKLSEPRFAGGFFTLSLSSKLSLSKRTILSRSGWRKAKFLRSRCKAFLIFDNFLEPTDFRTRSIQQIYDCVHNCNFFFF